MASRLKTILATTCRSNYSPIFVKTLRWLKILLAKIISISTRGHEAYRSNCKSIRTSDVETK